MARPPDMSTRVSADAATRVVTLVSESLTAEQDPTALERDRRTRRPTRRFAATSSPSAFRAMTSSRRGRGAQRRRDSRTGEAARHEGAPAPTADADRFGARLRAAHRKQARLPAERLVERLHRLGRPVARTRQPGGSPLEERSTSVRRYLLAAITRAPRRSPRRAGATRPQSPSDAPLRADVHSDD